MDSGIEISEAWKPTIKRKTQQQESRARADRRGSKSLSEQQGSKCTNQSFWITTNHSRASCFMRWRMTSRPHRLKKTSNMQSKRSYLHHTWLHRERKDKVIFYFYYLKSVSGLLITSLDLNARKFKRIPKGGYFCFFPNLVALTLITILYRPY